MEALDLLLFTKWVTGNVYLISYGDVVRISEPTNCSFGFFWLLSGVIATFVLLF